MQWWGWISIWVFVWLGLGFAILTLFEKSNKHSRKNFDITTGYYYNEDDISAARWISFFITLLISAVVHGLLK